MLALQKAYDVDLTYTSNAIEGNTLTLRETAELIEHGITAGGKPLRDHLEAVDQYAAVLWMRELAAKATPIDETTVRELHRRIVLRSQPEIGGVYSTLPRRVARSASASSLWTTTCVPLIILRIVPSVAIISLLMASRQIIHREKSSARAGGWRSILHLCSA